MKKQLVATFCIILFPFLIVSCVSTLLKETPPTFSKEIQFASPSGGFTKIDRGVYPAWKNDKTGNVITLVSDCSANVTLTGLQFLITDSIEQSKLLKEESTNFQGKPSLTYVSEGSLDGQAIEVKSISFKRKNCGYVTALSGKPKNLQFDQSTFLKFSESFKFE